MLLELGAAWPSAQRTHLVVLLDAPLDASLGAPLVAPLHAAPGVRITVAAGCAETSAGRHVDMYVAPAIPRVIKLDN